MGSGGAVGSSVGGVTVAGGGIGVGEGGSAVGSAGMAGSGAGAVASTMAVALPSGDGTDSGGAGGESVSTGDSTAVSTESGSCDSATTVGSATASSARAGRGPSRDVPTRAITRRREVMMRILNLFYRVRPRLPAGRALTGLVQVARHACRDWKVSLPPHPLLRASTWIRS